MKISVADRDVSGPAWSVRMVTGNICEGSLDPNAASLLRLAYRGTEL